MYTLKSIAQRGTLFGAAMTLVAAAILPAAPVFADELNPLTQRSLMLSSSAPGFVDTDGSGNSTAFPNSILENYAPAGSGPNGKKTGETFKFNVSTTATIRSFTFQYCQEAAGYCKAPGDNLGDARDDDPAVREDNDTAHPLGRSDLDFVDNFVQAGAGLDPVAGQFQVYVAGAASDETWTFEKETLEDEEHSENLTGKNNFVTLSSTNGELINNGQTVRIVFVASEDIYITNPGSGEFFVKINTFSDAGASTKVDGGVTVANVMTDSIHITTKVLETMSFSVGTRNPDTVAGPHGSCDAIDILNNNRLDLGNQNAEFSLETDTAYDVYSYWRLSSNSSGGATVYYSGNTLANTVGDEIAEMGSEQHSIPGTEQFGLALVDPQSDTPDPEGTDNDDVNDFPDNWIPNTYTPLTIGGEYDEGGTASISDPETTNNAKFAFYKSSLTEPEVIAQDGDDVLPCVTSKVRYVANIAPDTPAGVYTTKVNYLAAPQY